MTVDKIIHQKDSVARQLAADYANFYTDMTQNLQSLVSDLTKPDVADRLTPDEALKSRVIASLTPEQVERGREIIIAAGEWGRKNPGHAA